MSHRTVVALVLAATTTLSAAPAHASRVLVMDRRGTVHVRHDRLVARAPADERRAGAAASSARRAARPRTPRVLRRLLSTRQIDQATHDRALRDFRRAVSLSHSLSGSRGYALRGVVADLEGMAARGAVVARRLPALMATLEANIRWWTKGPLLGAGARVSFAGSGIVWQHYPGHGIQIQWLGTFGKANGLWGTGKDDAAFANLLSEAIALAGPRAGGIGFEYLFPFDGGNPPWVSGLAQGTALTALVRGGLRFHDRTYSDAARRALGIFRTPAPEGVAQPTAAGTHYLQYSFAPRVHIINGFIQSLNGLFDYAKVLDDAEGRALFEAGRAEAVVELPHYDTGGWSKYDEYSDSSLHYHELLRGFLSSLCNRLQRAGQSDEPFCRFTARFTVDLHTPPVITFPATQRVTRARRPARVRFTIDKPGTVTLVVARGRFSHRAVAAVSSGPHSFGWRPPHRGRYRISISARDLAGNSSTAAASARIRRR